ncbi:MAG: hypothetical protein M3Z26_06645 [Bacteroidota bacterium]|nr:hypothetical protein [Bacteroidota bacterium]
MENEINFFDAREYASNLRCTIQKTGKIGFTDYTQKKLSMNDDMSIRIGIDGIKGEYNNLVIQILNEVQPQAFKVNKAGNYFYINPKALLDELGLTYKAKNIMYEMISLNEDEKTYKLIKKEGKVV